MAFAQALRGAAKRGSALALPLLLLTPLLGAAPYMVPQSGMVSMERSHLDIGARTLLSAPVALDAPAALAGTPAVGGTWMLAGIGATLARPEMRLQVSGWEGGLHARSGSFGSDWGLQWAELVAEQTYPKGSFLITAGFSLDHATLYGSLQGPGGHSSVHAPLWGGGVTAGVRWPRDTKMGFLFRSNYLWLSGQGDWQGDQAALLGSQRFDLSGPGLTAQLELAF